MLGTQSGRCRQSRCSLHRPVTAERAIRAGSIADVPCICNNGRAGTIDGRQSFLPVGAPAVNSGVPRGRGHSLSGAAAASRSCSACSAAWVLAAARVRAARSSSPAAARPPGSSGMLRPSVGNRLTAVRWPPAARKRGLLHLGMHVGHGHALPCVNISAPVESPSRWERSLLDGPGQSPSRIRGETAVRACLRNQEVGWGVDSGQAWWGCR